MFRTLTKSDPRLTDLNRHFPFVNAIQNQVQSPTPIVVQCTPQSFRPSRHVTLLWRLSSLLLSSLGSFNTEVPEHPKHLVEPGCVNLPPGVPGGGREDGLLRRSKRKYSI